MSYLWAPIGRGAAPRLIRPADAAAVAAALTVSLCSRSTFNAIYKSMV